MERLVPPDSTSMREGAGEGADLTSNSWAGGLASTAAAAARLLLSHSSSIQSSVTVLVVVFHSSLGCFPSAAQRSAR